MFDRIRPEAKYRLTLYTREIDDQRGYCLHRYVDNDNKSVYEQAGIVEDEYYNQVIAPMTIFDLDIIRLTETPKPDYFKMTDELNPYYRKMAGRPFADFGELVAARRLDVQHEDTWVHIMKVIRFAQKVGAYDQLLERLGYLCCDAKTVTVIYPESPYSFLWFMPSRENWDKYYNFGRRDGPSLPGGMYHGGFICHDNRKWDNGTVEWSVHT